MKEEMDSKEVSVLSAIERQVDLFLKLKSPVFISFLTLFTFVLLGLHCFTGNFL